MAKTMEVNSHPCTSLDEGGGDHRPELVHQHDSLVNRACISPYDPHLPLAGVPHINIHNHGGTETVGRRAGTCGGTCIFIVESISSAPSWCASTTVNVAV